MQVEAVKLFVLKTINLGTLVYQLFLIQTNANNAQKYLHVDNYADYLTVCRCAPHALHLTCMPGIFFSRHSTSNSSVEEVILP